MRFLFGPLVVFLVALGGHAAVAQALYNQPVLVADPGTHTGRIESVAVDGAGKFAVTGSYDKTVRIWSLASGDLLRTVRLPEGPGYIGRIYAVAIRPQSDLVAVGGWTSGQGESESIYLFDPDTLMVRTRISVGEPVDVVNKLAFSKDGRYLAAAVGTQGLRIYDKEKQWAQIFSDPDYSRPCEDRGKPECAGKPIYGISFANDGRLATASQDQKIRLYGPGPDFKAIVPPMGLSREPLEIAFKPAGDVLAVGYSSPALDLLDGHDLHLLPGPNIDGISQKLAVVAWSRDGSELVVGGGLKVFIWDAAGQRRELPGGSDTVLSIATSLDGGILLAAAGPLLKYMYDDGRLRWQKTTAIARFASQDGILSTSRDGSIVDFGYQSPDHPLIRFDMKNLVLTPNPPADGITTPPRKDGLQGNGRDVTFNGNKLDLENSEEFRSLAVSSDAQRFVYGTTWTLRARDVNNQKIWHREMGDVWAVNITGDNRYVIAAYDDGTIRWHDLAAGTEVLALMVLNRNGNNNDYDWVAWTPEGYFTATPGAFEVLRWHVNNKEDNHGFARTLPVASIPGFRRPEVLPIALKTMDPLQAAGLAQTAALRSTLQALTGTTKQAGHKLHVLAIGINYKTSPNKLNYADKDAEKLAETLNNTQRVGGLYADVVPDYLDNENATRKSILDHLDTLQSSMNPDDVAVVMFSGHGAMINNHFYLLPNDANFLTGIRDKAISATDFKDAIAAIAGTGRVVVFLDACRSGAFVGDPAHVPNAAVLKTEISDTSAPMLILTSSSQQQLSREDPVAGHGYFTEALLDAISHFQDVNSHQIKMIKQGELTDYLDEKLNQLTGGGQTLGVLNLNFRGDLFVAGF